MYLFMLMSQGQCTPINSNTVSEPEFAREDPLHPISFDGSLKRCLRVSRQLFAAQLSGKRRAGNERRSGFTAPRGARPSSHAIPRLVKLNLVKLPLRLKGDGSMWTTSSQSHRDRSFNGTPVLPMTTALISYHTCWFHEL